MYPESQTFFPPSQAKLGAASKMRRHQSHNTVVPTGPPKPPRDPKRMSGCFLTSAYSTTSLPTTATANLPLSVLNGKPVKIQKQEQEQKPKFIWKEPPNLQNPALINEDV